MNKNLHNEDEIVVANPNSFLVVFGIFCAFLSAIIGYYTFNYKYFTEVNAESILIWIFAILLIFFAVLSIISIFSTKKVILTNTSLTISNPLLRATREIFFEDVYKVYDQDYLIQRSENFKLKTIYSGKKTIIELYDSEKIIITSLEVTNYPILAQNLKNITKSYFKIKQAQY